MPIGGMSSVFQIYHILCIKRETVNLMRESKDEIDRLQLQYYGDTLFIPNMQRREKANGCDNHYHSTNSSLP